MDQPGRMLAVAAINAESLVGLYAGLVPEGKTTNRH